MTSIAPSIEFFVDLPEELSNVSLRRNKSTGVRSVVLFFDTLKALEKFNSFKKGFTGSLHLKDSEGEITVAKPSLKIVFGGDDGDDLQRVECGFELEKEDHWERFMRFMHRYADANGMAYSDSSPDQSSEA